MKPRMNPYTQGYASFGQGLECPYVQLSPEALDWLEGEYDAALDAQWCREDPDVLEALADISEVEILSNIESLYMSK